MTQTLPLREERLNLQRRLRVQGGVGLDIKEPPVLIDQIGSGAPRRVVAPGGVPIWINSDLDSRAIGAPSGQGHAGARGDEHDL